MTRHELIERLTPGAGRGGCIAFCFVTGIVGLVISLMMSSKMAAFAVPGVEHKWDMKLKAAACRNAALAYVAIGFVLVIAPLFTPTIASAGRAVTNAAFSTAKNALPKEKHGLLGYTRKRSDLSDSDVELQ